MDAMVDAERLRPAARAFIVVAALTGARRGELQKLTWGQVDLAERRITLSDTKGAKLMKRAGIRTEVLSLPPLAAAALDTLRLTGIAETAELSKKGGNLDNVHLSDAALVFPAAHGGRISVNADWRRVRAAAGLPADLTLHGLRHSIGTVAVLAGLTAPEVQALLRHRNASTSSKYVHIAHQHRARLQDRVVETIMPDATDTKGALSVHRLPMPVGRKRQ
jgi:integrase